MSQATESPLKKIAREMQEHEEAVARAKQEAREIRAAVQREQDKEEKRKENIEKISTNLAMMKEATNKVSTALTLTSTAYEGLVSSNKLADMVFPSVPVTKSGATYTFTKPAAFYQRLVVTGTKATLAQKVEEAVRSVHRNLIEQAAGQGMSTTGEPEFTISVEATVMAR